MTEAERRIEQFEAAFKAHGYIVDAEPLPGMENVFADSLAEGFKRVERVLAANAKHHGFRGLSKNALRALHADLPVPAFGVEVETPTPPAA